ncbi:MAG: bifunctional precorrin-2 dehydrogenase/sirohydrochlorin ferrochelatase [Saprospiraceae bacterium]
MSQNPLYPIFLKLHQLKLLIVGAGEVGEEKLRFILKSSPEANITIVAKEVLPPVRALLKNNPNAKIKVIEKAFEVTDVDGFDLVIAATNFKEVNLVVQKAAKTYKILVNVADTPDLCDFYLGSIVTRGDLKVAISTNGKSPTFAKRFRQLLEEILPKETGDLLQNLKIVRDNLKGNFEAKVKALNELTASLVDRQN